MCHPWLRDSREHSDSRERRNTHRKRRDEDEADFENQRRACRGVLRAGFFTMATPAAAAPVDYCRHDVTSGMRGCGYTSLEQCQAMSSGRGGSCYENPFPEGASASGNASSNAYAYQPKHHASKGARKPVENR
jgi:hypothetical protein